MSYEELDERVIGFFGLRGSGKDTASDCVLAASGSRLNLKFASTLKDLTVKLLVLAGHTNPEWVYGGPERDQHDERVSQLTGGRFTTTRQLLQHIGTEFGRGLHPDIWVKLLHENLLASARRLDPYYITVTDCRFPNEFDYIRQIGGARVLVERPGCEPDGHASEVIPAKPSEFDYVLHNDGTKDELDDEVQRMLVELHKQRYWGKVDWIEND